MTTSVRRGDASRVLAKLGNSSVDLVVADPPYAMKYKSGKWHGHYIQGEHEVLPKDIDPVVNDDGIVDFLPGALHVLKPAGAIYVFTTLKTIDIWKPYFERYFRLRNIITWVKNNHTMGSWKSGYRSRGEVVLYGDRKDGPGHSLRGGREHDDMWFFRRVPDAKRLSPTQKPEAMIECMIQESSHEGEVVLDPFVGSGTTGAVAKACGRSFMGLDVVPKEVEKARNRIKRTRRDPTRVDSDPMQIRNEEWLAMNAMIQKKMGKAA